MDVATRALMRRAGSRIRRDAGSAWSSIVSGPPRSWAAFIPDLLRTRRYHGAHTVPGRWAGVCTREINGDSGTWDAVSLRMGRQGGARGVPVYGHAVRRGALGRRRRGARSIPPAECFGYAPCRSPARHEPAWTAAHRLH